MGVFNGCSFKYRSYHQRSRQWEPVKHYWAVTSVWPMLSLLLSPMATFIVNNLLAILRPCMACASPPSPPYFHCLAEWWVFECLGAHFCFAGIAMGTLCGPEADQPCSQGLSSFCLLEKEGAGREEILGTRLGSGRLAGLHFDIIYVKSLY